MRLLLHFYYIIFTAKTILFSSVFLLFLRLWVSWIFIKSGITKIATWDSTLYLFTEEYKVPLLSPEAAAYTGTIVELLFPILLVFGILTKLSATMLFIFNIIAIISYSHVLLPSGFGLFSLGAMDHQIWGLMLFVLMIFGGGKFAVDNKIFRY